MTKELNSVLHLQMKVGELKNYLKERTDDNIRLTAEVLKLQDSNNRGRANYGELKTKLAGKELEVREKQDIINARDEVILIKEEVIRVQEEAIRVKEEELTLLRAQLVDAQTRARNCETSSSGVVNYNYYAHNTLLLRG
ncbi:unnamed protein product, partial [Allacma fusca]